MTLRSQASGLDLPSVFPSRASPSTALGRRCAGRSMAARSMSIFQRVEFAGSDAAGSARGSYRHTGEGPGSST